MWTSSCSNIAFGYAGAGPTAFRDIQQCASGGCANIVQHHCLSSDGQSGSGMWDPNVTVRAILSGKVRCFCAGQQRVWEGAAAAGGSKLWGKGSRFKLHFWGVVS